MDSSPSDIGKRRFDDHYGRRHWHMVDSWSQEHGSLSGDDPCARGLACVVTAGDGGAIHKPKLRRLDKGDDRTPEESEPPMPLDGTSGQAAHRRRSNRLSHAAVWFQLVKMRLAYAGPHNSPQGDHWLLILLATHVIAIRSLCSANAEPPTAAYRGLDQNCAKVRFSDSSRKPTSLCPPGSSSITLRPGNRANSARADSSGTSQSSGA